MTPLFLKVHRDMIAPWEGGYVDHPSDPGGATNMGVSMYLLEDMQKREADFLASIGIAMPVTKDVIKNLTKQQSEEIFYHEFWERLGCDEMTPPVAFLCYDTSGNMGIGGMTWIAQRAYNAVNPVTPLAVDGKYGKLTKAAMCENLGTEFIDAWEQIREARYRSIVENKPTSGVFLNGWLRRCKESAEYAKTLL